MSYRRFAISDIHGCALTFQALLTRIGLKPSDTLFILGDSIDRGPSSKEVLDILLELTRNGYDVRVLRGNHEDMLLRSVNGTHDAYSPLWIEWWGEITLCSFAVSMPSEIPDKYLRYLEQMPLFEETDDFVIVHASLLADTPLEETPAHIMLWGQDWHSVKEIPCGKRIISGHKVVDFDTIIASLSTRHILIDNGCVMNQGFGYGNLIAIDIDTLEVISQPRIDTVIDFLLDVSVGAQE